MSEWQGIETAPKDEYESVLAWDPLADSLVVVWWARDHWEVAWDGAINDDITHWMPLPEPPHTEKQT